MLVKPEICFAFKCPCCGGVKPHVFDVFHMSGGSQICACSCTKSCMHLIFGDAAVTIEFLCPYCGGIHSYRLAIADLLHGNLNELVCCETELVCAYAGDPSRVEKEIAQYHSAVDTLLSKLKALDDTELVGSEQDEIDRILLKADNGKMQDATLVLSSLCTVEDMLYQEKIVCECGAKKFELAFLNGYIQVKCAQCGAYVRIAAQNSDAVQKIRCSDCIVLTK